MQLGVSKGVVSVARSVINDSIRLSVAPLPDRNPWTCSSENVRHLLRCSTGERVQLRFLLGRQERI